MNQPNRSHKRFVVVMAALLIPTLGLFYFVTTMQRRWPRPQLVGNEGVVVRNTLASFWGARFKRHIEAFDLKTGEVTEYVIPEKAPYIVLDGGRSLAYLDDAKTLRVLHGGVDQMVHQSDFPDSPGQDWRTKHGLYASASFGDDYVFNLGDGNLLRWNRKTRESQSIVCPQAEGVYRYWDGDAAFVCIEKTDLVHVYRLEANGLTEVGQTIELPSSVIFDGGAKYLHPWRSETSWQVVDTATGETLAELPNLEGLWGWRARGETLVGVYGIETPGGALTIDAVRNFDPVTLEPLHDQIPVDRVEISDFGFNRDGTRMFLLATDRRTVHVIDFEKQTCTPFVFPDHMWWWWPLSVGGIAFAALWWFVWSFVMRRNERSFQPLVDIALFHAVLLVSFGARFYAHANGPSWNNALHSWESVGFLGAGASFIAWVALWIVFGPQRWGLRVGAIGAAFTLAIGFVIVIWDVNAVDFDASLARAEMLIGVVAHVSTLLGLQWGLWACGLRLSQRQDSTLARPTEPSRRFSLQHMIAWTIIAAILFVVLGMRKLEIPNEGHLMKLMADGFAGGLASTALLWLGLGNTWIRFPLAALGLMLSGFTYWAIGWLHVAQVGAALIPMVWISTAAYRWNGYRLRRPVRIGT